MNVNNKYSKFNIFFFVGDEDFSHLVSEVLIYNSVSMLFPLYIIKLSSSIKTNMIKKVKNNTLYLKIVSKKNEVIYDTHEVDLTYIKDNWILDLSESGDNINQNSFPKASTLSTILALPISSVVTSNKIVNVLGHNVTINDILKKIMTAYNVNIYNHYTTQFTTTKFNQILLPPLKVKEAMLFLHYYYGLFHGPFYMYFGVNNDLYIVDLNKAIKSNRVIKLLFNDKYEGITDVWDGKVLRTYITSPPKMYNRMELFNINKANKITFIEYPEDFLYSSDSITLDEAIKKYSVYDESVNIKNSKLKEHLKKQLKHGKYNFDFIGKESVDGLMYSNLSSMYIDDTSNISIVELKADIPLNFLDMIYLYSSTCLTFTFPNVTTNIQRPIGNFISFDNILSFKLNDSGKYDGKMNLTLVRSNYTYGD